MLQTFQKWTFCKVCVEEMIDHQYRENGMKNIYSNYNQMRAYVERSPSQSKNWHSTKPPPIDQPPTTDHILIKTPTTDHITNRPPPAPTIKTTDHRPNQKFTTDHRPNGRPTTDHRPNKTLTTDQATDHRPKS